MEAKNIRSSDLGQAQGGEVLHLFDVPNVATSLRFASSRSKRIATKLLKCPANAEQDQHIIKKFND
ncbi:MAG: hypothetical protein ABWY00_08230 [Dongiaceae bacterium]